MKIKAGIIGSTGYAGAELVRLLVQHPEAEICWCGSRSYIGEEFSSVYRNLFRIVDSKCLDDNMEELAEEADVIFTATPQGFCASMMNDSILSKTKIVDLSADFRLKDVAVYEKWYKIEHKSPQYLPEAVYGLCEINREQIRKTPSAGQPGLLHHLLYPYLISTGEGRADNRYTYRSGTSGAGRGAKVANLYCEVNENIKAYGVTTHRHTPEIEEQLSYACGKPVLLNFTPHLVPMNRGILVTAYASLAGDVSAEAVQAAYEKYYGEEFFIRLLGQGVCPETRWVEGSNFVDIGFQLDPRTHRIVAMGALDNLVKGAAGQALQNMNLMFGLPENTGLMQPPLFP